MSAFEQQIAVVTGASSGIGRAIALGLGAQGAALWLIGRRAEALEEVAAQIGPPAPPPRIYQADLTDDAAMRAFAGRLEHEAHRVDILVHSAGVIALGPLSRAPVEDFDHQYRVNVRAPYLLTQALLPLLVAAKGQVLFINSTSGLRAAGGLAQYAATKHALRALADSLREEVNVEGVRVITVFPGRTASPMQEAIHRFEGKPYRPEALMQPADVAGAALAALALPRTAEVTEVRMRPFKKPGT